MVGRDRQPASGVDYYAKRIVWLHIEVLRLGAGKIADDEVVCTGNASRVNTAAFTLPQALNQGEN